MQPSKWAGNLRGRDSKDAHGHLHFKRIFSKYPIAYMRTRWPCLHCARRIKGDVSGDTLALLRADGRTGRVSAGLEHQTRALMPQKAYSALPLDMLIVYLSGTIKPRHIYMKL